LTRVPKRSRPMYLACTGFDCVSSSTTGLNTSQCSDLRTPRGYLQQLLSRQKLLAFCSNGPAGSLRDCALRQSRNSLNASPKRGDGLLDHESLVRQVRHSPLDDHEGSEAEDRVPPGVGYHYVMLTWQSFIPGNIEKELHETLEQGPANVVDILSSANAVAVLRPEEDVAELLWMGSAELNQAA